MAYRLKDGTNYAEFTTFSQELRLAGQTEKFDWLVSAFLADERLDNRANFLYGNNYEAVSGPPAVALGVARHRRASPTSSPCC